MRLVCLLPQERVWHDSRDKLPVSGFLLRGRVLFLGAVQCPFLCFLRLAGRGLLTRLLRRSQMARCVDYGCSAARSLFVISVLHETHIGSRAERAERLKAPR